METNIIGDKLKEATATIATLSRELDELRSAADRRERQIGEGYRQMESMLGELELQKRSLEKANASISAASEFINRMTDTMDELLIVLDKRGMIARVNKRFEELLGIPAAQAKGQSPDALVRASDLDALRPQLRGKPRASVLFELILQSKRLEVEVNLVGPQGGQHTHLLRGSVLHDAQGKLDGAVIVAADITKLRELMAAMEQELKEAQAMQGLLLYKRDTGRRCSVDVIYRQATYGGGDWFYVDVVDHYLVFVIADVLGHGTPAAMLASFGRGFMAAVTTAARLVVSAGELLKPDVILRQLGGAIYESTGGSTGMTCFALVLDMDDGRLEFSNGGHLFPFMLSRPVPSPDGGEPARELTSLFCRGDRLGFSADSSLSRGVGTLREGDRLLLYTDGLVESMNERHEPFGERRLRRLLRAIDHGPAREMVARIDGELTTFLGSRPLDDDFMLAVIQLGVGNSPGLV
jgi:PAS domain S-box-containing protein